MIFEGTNLLNNQQVAIKFVRIQIRVYDRVGAKENRNLEKVMRPSCVTNIELTKSLWAVVSVLKMILIVLTNAK